MKKFLSMVLAGVLMMGCMVPSALAVGLDASAQHDAVVSDNRANGTSEVIVNVEAAQMTVTVPVSLPASVDAQGNVTVATNAKIINKSYAPVMLSKYVDKVAAADWTEKVSTYDFTKDQIGTKNFAISFNGVDSYGEEKSGIESVLKTEDGYIRINGSNETDNTDEYTFTYDVKLSGQHEALTDVKVADVVFTIEWANYSVFE